MEDTLMNEKSTVMSDYTFEDYIKDFEYDYLGFPGAEEIPDEESEGESGFDERSTGR